MLLGMITTILCNVVDSAITGQFLGGKAVAAMGLVAPVVSVVNIVTTLFATGTSQMYTTSMGKADTKRVNQIFSTMTVCTLVLCFLASIAVFLLAPAYVGIAAKALDAEDKRMIRIRDNGQPFDPVKWYETNHPEDPASNIGIRLVTGLAKRVQYIPAMSMNHIMIYL